MCHVSANVHSLGAFTHTYGRVIFEDGCVLRTSATKDNNSVMNYKGSIFCVTLWDILQVDIHLHGIFQMEDPTFWSTFQRPRHRQWTISGHRNHWYCQQRPKLYCWKELNCESDKTVRNYNPLDYVILPAWKWLLGNRKSSNIFHSSLLSSISSSLQWLGCSVYRSFMPDK